MSSSPCNYTAVLLSLSKKIHKDTFPKDIIKLFDLCNVRVHVLKA